MCSSFSGFVCAFDPFHLPLTVLTSFHRQQYTLTLFNIIILHIPIYAPKLSNYSLVIDIAIYNQSFNYHAWFNISSDDDVHVLDALLDCCCFMVILSFLSGIMTGRELLMSHVFLFKTMNILWQQFGFRNRHQLLLKVWHWRPYLENLWHEQNQWVRNQMETWFYKIIPARSHFRDYLKVARWIKFRTYTDCPAGLQFWN